MDIAAVIEKILFKEEALVIPGLGTIISHYKPAAIDHVQGLIHPPSKSLSFKEDQNIDGLFLTTSIAEHYNLSIAEAEQSLKVFVKEKVEALDRREIVIFPNVGRLYRDYEQNLKFLQDNTNFNPNSFGLPVIQFYPIHRNKEEVLQRVKQQPGASSPVKKASTVAKTAKPKSRKSLRAAMPMLAGFLVVAAAVGIFFLTQTLWEDPNTVQKVPIKDPVRLNKKPSPDKAGILSLENNTEKEAPTVDEKTSKKPSQEKIDEALAEFTDEDGEFQTEINTESLTYGPSQKECIVIIGAYGQKAGVKKRVKEIIDLGMDVYQNKKKGLTQVGVQFLYEDQYELRRNLDIIRKKFGQKCWVLKE